MLSDVLSQCLPTQGELRGAYVVRKHVLHIMVMINRWNNWDYYNFMKLEKNIAIRKRA